VISPGACPRELDSQITDILTGLVFGGPSNVFGGPSNGLDTNLKTGLKNGVRALDIWVFKKIFY